MRKFLLTLLSLAALALLAEAACYFICIPLACTGSAPDADLLAVFGGAPEIRYLAAAKHAERAVHRPAYAAAGL
jgi:hypothetical protein